MRWTFAFACLFALSNMFYNSSSKEVSDDLLIESQKFRKSHYFASEHAFLSNDDFHDTALEKWAEREAHLSSGGKQNTYAYDYSDDERSQKELMLAHAQVQNVR